MFNGRIYIDKGGEKGALLIHGFTSCTYQLKEMADFLANKGITVLAPLVAGHGTQPEDLAKTDASDWLRSVEIPLEFLQSRVKKLYVIGNSFGGNLAFELAKKYEVAGVISLSTPIFLSHHGWIKLRLKTDYRFRKNYCKVTRFFMADYDNFSDEVIYSTIPIKSLHDFLNFIKEKTIPHLAEIKDPALIIHTTKDQVIKPKSAQYIYDHLGSAKKEIHWVKSFNHEITRAKKRDDVFEKIYQFIRDN
ncbi:MAG: alpha/beta fold hydrolase [bacterium]